MHFDIREIVSAWVSKVNPTDVQKELATKRAEICNQCPKVEKVLIEAPGTRYCGVCGCFIEAKIYSYKEGACPTGKWDELDKNYRSTGVLKVLKDPKKLV